MGVLADGGLNPNPNRDPNPNPNPKFQWRSNSQNAVQVQQHSGCWEIDGNSVHLFLSIHVLGTITVCVLCLSIQLEIILDSVPAVTA